MHASCLIASMSLEEDEAHVNAGVRPRPPTDVLETTTADASYESMVRGYRSTGGVLRRAEILRQMREVYSQPLSVFARWTIQREIVSFACDSQHLVPIFQFDLPSMKLRPEVRAIACELVPAFDEWEVALWFVQPNTWLPDAAAPVDYIDSDPEAVLQAARADRFIATG